MATGSIPSLAPDASQLKRRLLVQGAGFSLLLLAAFGAALVGGITLQRRDDQRAELRQLAAGAAGQLPLIAHETREQEGKAKFKGRERLRTIEGVEPLRLQWFDQDGRLLSELGGLPLPAQATRPPTLVAQARPVWQQWPGGISLWQPVIGGPSSAGPAPLLGSVRVALSDQPARRDLQRLQRGLLLGALVSVVAALLVGRRMLHAAFAPLQAQITALEQFTADVSHELRHPLTALRTVLAAVPMTMRAEPGLAWRELDAISRGMGELLDDLLCLARLQQSEPAQCFDLLELLEDVVRTYQVGAAERGIRLEISPDPAATLLPVVACSQQLLRLFTNLLLNAIRHSPDGGTVVLQASTASKRVVVQVIDEGPGIPLAWQRHVFERFWRGADRGGQTGLGLAIARAIARRHGGDLRLDVNRPGRCVLQVELPAAEPTS